MAIKVNGTTVIDDSRNLVNIVSGAGSSTDFNAVGTYASIFNGNGPDYGGGTTVAINGNANFEFYNLNGTNGGFSTKPLGTWRTMAYWGNNQRSICVRVA